MAEGFPAPAGTARHAFTSEGNVMAEPHDSKASTVNGCGSSIATLRLPSKTANCPDGP